MLLLHLHSWSIFCWVYNSRFSVILFEPFKDVIPLSLGSTVSMNSPSCQFICCSFKEFVYFSQAFKRRPLCVWFSAVLIWRRCETFLICFVFMFIWLGIWKSGFWDLTFLISFGKISTIISYNTAFTWRILSLNGVSIFYILDLLIVSSMYFTLSFVLHFICLFDFTPGHFLLVSLLLYHFFLFSYV